MKLFNIEDDRKAGRIIFEFSVLFMVINFLCASGIWQGIMNQWQVLGEEKLFAQVYINSGGSQRFSFLDRQSLYYGFLSGVFALFGNREALVLIVNLLFQILGVVFIFLAVRQNNHLEFSILILFLTGISARRFFPVAADNSMHMVWVLCAMTYLICVKMSAVGGEGNIRRTFCCSLSGILVGFLLYVDFAGALPVFFCVMPGLQVSEEGTEKNKSSIFIFLLFVAFTFGILFCSFGESAWKHWFLNARKFLYSEEQGKQYAAMYLLYGVNFLFSLATEKKRL